VSLEYRTRKRDSDGLGAAVEARGLGGVSQRPTGGASESDDRPVKKRSTDSSRRASAPASSSSESLDEDKAAASGAKVSEAQAKEGARKLKRLSGAQVGSCCDVMVSF
jgi:hypothetical protein